MQSTKQQGISQGKRQKGTTLEVGMKQVAVLQIYSKL